MRYIFPILLSLILASASAFAQVSGGGTSGFKLPVPVPNDCLIGNSNSTEWVAGSCGTGSGMTTNGSNAVLPDAMGALGAGMTGNCTMDVNAIITCTKPQLQEQWVVDTAAVTWTSPSGITTGTQFEFTLVGPGGGGGGCNTGATSGRGGGGGAGAVWVTSGLSPSVAYTIAIGTGGAAGANTGTDGATGGSTTLLIGSTTVTAAGGVGGIACAVSTSTTAGGTATNGTVNIVGQFGGVTGVTNNFGGNGPFGLGRGGIASGAAVAGVAGAGYGAGGAGGIGASAVGAVGSQGALRVRWVQ